MKWFYNFKISTKLISSFVLMAIILATVAIYELSNMGKLKEGSSNLYHNNLLPVSDLASAQIAYNQIRFNIVFMNTLAAPADKSKNEDAIKAFRKQIEDYIGEYGKKPLTQPEKELLSKFDPAWRTFNQFLDQCIQLAYAGDLEGYKKVSVDFKKAADALDGVLTDLVSMNKKLAEQTDTKSDQVYTTTRSTTIAVIIAALFISIGLGYAVSQIIARPLKRVVGVVGQVADGDLRETSDIDTQDEVGQVAKSINEMVLNLRTTVSSIMASAESVSAASQQISATTEEIASGSTSQASAAQTMSEMFKELSVAITSAAKSAEQAAALSGNTMSIAKEGGEVIRSSIDGMNAVNSQMSRLQEDSNKIGEIIEVINDIAEQTNLLALNAAIEAARAGEQGRGFAVVADEVRKLAERSGEATKQITTIIKGMQENTRHSVTAVEVGVASSQKTGEAFGNIIKMVNESAQNVSEIAAACEQQAVKSSEVQLAIESISAATEEAAASSEETASTAQSLAGLAEELNNAVSIFKVK